MGEYKGKYEREPECQEELVDRCLQGIGVRFTDRTQEIPQRKVQKKISIPSLASLLAADSALIFMCLADKIELAYGLVFLAAASAFLGAKVSNARV